MSVPEYLQHIIGISLLGFIYYLTRRGVARRMERGAQQVVADLRAHNSIDVYSAVSLEYAQDNWLKFGLRDYRRKALQSMVTAGVVGKTSSDKYYLIENPAPGKGVTEE